MELLLDLKMDLGPLTGWTAEQGGTKAPPGPVGLSILKGAGFQEKRCIRMKKVTGHRRTIWNADRCVSSIEAPAGLPGCKAGLIVPARFRAVRRGPTLEDAEVTTVESLRYKGLCARSRRALQDR